MSKSNKKACTKTLLDKLNNVDKKIGNLSDRLKTIKELVTKQTDDTTEIEECPDVAASERALVEAIEKLYVDELLTREPEGDA